MKYAYHLVVRFSRHDQFVRVATTLTERTAKQLGNYLYPMASEVCINRTLRGGARPYRKPRHS